MAIVSKNIGYTGGAWQVSIMTEPNSTISGSGPELPAPPSHCPHTGGDIEISGNPRLEAHPLSGGVLLAAGRDLKISGNPNTQFTGTMIIHEQFQFSGDLNFTGGIISNDYCDTADSPIHFNELNGNANITNPGNLEVDLGTAVVRIVRWLEL
jgi:hypothetical protein